MKEFEKLKAEYDATPIPPELNDRIQSGIRQGRRRRVLRICRRSLGTAAACLVVTVGVLNVSPPVAAAAADLPVLGPLFQVLTVRTYDQTPLPPGPSRTGRTTGRSSLPPAAPRSSGTSGRWT